jgi:hypothetical protein
VANVAFCAVDLKGGRDAAPRMTYSSHDVPGAMRDVYRVAIDAALKRCSLVLVGGGHQQRSKYLAECRIVSAALFRSDAAQRRMKPVDPSLGIAEIKTKALFSYVHRYERTLNTTSCSRACSTTFRPNSSFGATSVTGA